MRATAPTSPEAVEYPARSKAGARTEKRESLTRQIAMEHTKPAPKGSRAFSFGPQDRKTTALYQPARASTFIGERMSEQVMVCKLQLHSAEPCRSSGNDGSVLTGANVRFGAVWEGSTEQQAKSENAVFGHWTPCAEFKGSILNQQVVDKLVVGKKYYVTFTEAPD